jgi:hypothetical protein
MGAADRLIRTILALVLIGLWLAGIVQGVAAVVVAGLAAGLVATSTLSWCPLYSPFGVNTVRQEGEPA